MNIEHHLNTLIEEIERFVSRYVKKKTPTKFKITGTTDNTQIDGIEKEKVCNTKYLGQTIAMGNRTRHEVLLRMEAGWTGFGKYKEIFLNKLLSMSLKTRVSHQ